MSEEEKYMNEYTSPTMRFVNEEWIDRVLGMNFRLRLIGNCGSMFQLSKKQKKQLSKHMQALAKVEVTHVHKYLCKTTLQQKFCNAIPNKQRVTRISRSNRSQTYEFIYKDQIPTEWLYDNTVRLNNCKDWFDNVMDTKVCNVTFELPVSSVSAAEEKPIQDTKAPIMTYPQHQLGTCGISALSSAFSYLFDANLAGVIHVQSKDYLRVLSQPVEGKSRKSVAMKFLIQVFFDTKPLNKMYTVKRIPPPFISISQMKQKNEFYNSIILCLLKTSTMSRDHIVAIARGWIFDPNLMYAIDLNDENLKWCAGHGKGSIEFNGFYEQVQVKVMKKQVNNK